MARATLMAVAVLAATASAMPPSQSVSPAPSTQPDVARKRESLDDLLVAGRGPSPSVSVLTMRLLDAGTDETGRFLRMFESAALRAQREGEPLEHLARLGGRLREVPARIASVIGRPEIPAQARAGAIAVSLEILRRDPTDRTLAVLVTLLERGHPIESAGAAGLRPGVIAVVSGLTTARVGSDAEFERLYSAAAPRLSVSVVDGIAASDAPDEALRRLASLLGRIPSVDGAVLNRIHVVADRDLAFADRGTRERIADYLTDERAFARHESAAALGTLGDRDSVLSLIWLLEDPAPSVREAAHEALKLLTSMTIAGDPVRWRLWLSRQELWWETEGEALVSRILVADRPELVQVLRATCTKRLYQREIAPHLIRLAQRDDVESIEISLSALGTLRAPAALPTIRGLTSHPDPLVRRRANAALRSYRHANISIAFTAPLQLSASQD